MARADDHSPLAHCDAAADLSGVDLILECERAARPAGQEWTAGIFIADATIALGTCPLECRDHPEKTTPWRQDRDEPE